MAMNASPDGSDDNTCAFMSCLAEQSISSNNNNEQVFEASDIPLSQDSDAQSPSSENVQALLTQAPAQSLSDNDDEVDTDEFQSVNQDATQTPPITQASQEETVDDNSSSEEDQSPQSSATQQDSTTMTPAKVDTRRKRAKPAGWVRPDSVTGETPPTAIAEEKKLADTPAAPTVTGLIGTFGGSELDTANQQSILASSPESTAQSDQTDSPQGMDKSISLLMTQPPARDDSDNDDNDDQSSSAHAAGAIDTSPRGALSSQPDSVEKTPATSVQASSPDSHASDGFNVALDMDDGEPDSSPENGVESPWQGSTPRSPDDNELPSGEKDNETQRSLSGEQNVADMTRDERLGRQKEFLASLGFASPTKSVNKSQAPESDKDSRYETCNEDINVPTGMLFNSPCKKRPLNTQETISEPDATISGSSIDELYERHPHRQFQIKSLVSLIGTSMAQTKCQGDDPYVPPPIFVSGPSGSGKTSVVRDAVETLQRYHSSCLDASEGRVIGTAYVNCAAIEPSTLEAVLESAYSQLTPRQTSHSRRPKKKQKRRKQSTSDLLEAKKPEAKSSEEMFDGSHLETDISVPVPSNDANDGEYNSDDEAEMEDELEACKTQLSQVEVDEKKAPVNSPGRRKTRQSMNGRNDRKRRAPDTNVPTSREKSMRKTESVAKSHAAPVAFGRVITPLFGRPSLLCPDQKPGSAFLILDHAERLFTLSANQRGDPNNFLAQLLLLPQVMELNLTLIIVSRSTLLDCSRINNSASVQKALGTIANGVRPVRVHFPAYKGKPVFKTILKQPNVIELIVGRRNHLRKTEHDCAQDAFRETTIDSFLDTVVQSLSSVTRDVREMIRIGRALWPTYILPLDRGHIRSTLDAARRRSRKSAGMESVLIGDSNGTENNVEDLQKELLAILDETFLPRMKRCLEEELFVLKGDDTHASEGSSVASCDYDLPFLSKCLLLAAFICQSNKPDKDKALFTIQKKGRKNNRQGHRVGSNDAEGLAFGSSALEQQQLKMLRPRTFPLERMLSVFVNIVGLIGGEDKLRLSTNSAADTRELLRSIGSTCFFENLARLREIGLLHEVQGNSTGGGDGFASFDGINMMSTKYWCALNRDDAEALATTLDFQLTNFLLAS